jgi:hypothetical protein
MMNEPRGMGGDYLLHYRIWPARRHDGGQRRFGMTGPGATEVRLSSGNGSIG